MEKRDMSKPEAVLAEIETLARGVGCRWPDMMSPGLSKEALESISREHGIALPTGARQLLLWRNGVQENASPTPALAEIWMFPRFYLASFKECMALLGTDIAWRAAGRYPMFFNGSDSFLLLESATGAVIASGGHSKERVISATFEDFLRTWRDIYREGGVTVNEVGHVKYAASEVGRIGRRNHPGLGYWYERYPSA
jgi:hypothetical protein